MEKRLKCVVASQNPAIVISYKVLISQVGDGAVGKTSLLYTNKYNQFPEEHELPVGHARMQETYTINVNGMSK